MIWRGRGPLHRFTVAMLARANPLLAVTVKFMALGPSPNLRNLTIGLDLLCVIGLIFGGIQIFKDHESDWFRGKVLFWMALIAGLGLFLIRLKGGTASWWTGHLNYELSPRP